MADNTTLDVGSGGDTIASDDIAGVKYQRVKIHLGADGISDGDVHSSNALPVSSLPLTANIGTVSSLATQATLAQVSTFTQSTNTILAQSLSSSTVRITIAADDVGIGGGTQYVEDTTSTLPTGTVFLWKQDVSTLKAVSSSFPLPVSSAPITANIGTIGTIATQATLAQVSTFTASTNALLSTQTLRLNNISTFTNSTNAILAQPLSSSTFRITIAVDDVGIGGGTQYVDGNTSTLPTGTVMLWKSAVSTLVPVTTSLGLPVNVIAGSLNANTEYLEGNTTTLATGIVSLWKSGVSTLTAVTSSFPLPVSSAPLTANIGTVSSLATQATLAEISTFNSSTVSLLSSNKLRLENISTFTNSTNTLLLAVSSNTASSNALVSTQSVTLGNISTFTNSSNALLSTISARLAAVPTGPYVQPVPVSSNGLSVFMTLDADETEEQISATACTVYGVWAANTGTAGAYIKLFNGTSSAIQVSSATPLIVMPIPGSSTQSLVGANYNVGGMGITFSTACCVAAVTGAANNNTTAPAESTIICNIFYKN